MKSLFYTLIAAVCLMASASGQETGLASKYLKDAGIGNDSAVLLHDDFEVGKIGEKWDEITRRLGRGAADNADPVQEEIVPAIARGTRSARVQLSKELSRDWE